MLFQGSAPHPAHKAFGDSVDADYRHFETGKRIEENTDDTDTELDRAVIGATLDHYDVVISEGSAPIQTLLAYKLRNPEATTIYLAADETFYLLPERTTRFFWYALSPATRFLLDGTIGVGQDVVDWASRFINTGTTRIVHPPITDEKYELLSGLEASSEAPLRLLTAGTKKWANNHPTLVDGVRLLREQTGEDIELVILGNGHEGEPYIEPDFVTAPGFVPLDEFADYFESATLYIQPSVGDSFPVAALEGILSGTPTFVSDAVGVRKLLPSEQVFEPTAQSIANTIQQYLSETTQEEREELAKEQRPRVAEITEENQMQQFQDAVSEIANE